MTLSQSSSSTRRGEGPNTPLGAAGCLVHLAASVGGFSLILIVWVVLLREAAWNLTFKDVLYWALVAGMISARYFDVVRFGAKTPEGAPATLEHVRRHAWTVIPVSVVAWAIAHSIDL